jgi:hypothetical protein
MLNDCTQEGCTVATTGKCLLNNELADCPNYQSSDDQTSGEEDLLPEPDQNPSFGQSATLAEEVLGDVMGDRYCTVIGILGAPDSGKTAALVSIYLKLCHGSLEGFRYADSKSLMALDEISRGARRWAGSPPEQMTAHTEIKDDRAAGFLHLRLRAESDHWPVDFLLPDLPGEWSDAMVDESRYERLAFIRRADVIWLMVDGVQLTTPSTRHLSVHRVQLYLQRLKQFFPDLPRVIIVVTRADQGTISEKTIKSIQEEGHTLGIDLDIHSIASFSQDQKATPAGTGIAELIKMSVGADREVAAIWPPFEQESDSNRAIWTAARGIVI